MTYQQKTNLNNLAFKVLMAGTALFGLTITTVGVVQNPTRAGWLTLLGSVVLLAAIYVVVFVGSATFHFSKNGFSYKYPPWVIKAISVAATDILSICIKKSNALSDFGGWGYRFKKNHRGLIFMHDWCAEFELKNGERFTVTLADEPAFRAVAQVYYTNSLR